MSVLAVFYDTSQLCSTSAIFFFNDTATTEIYTLSLHDALPISDCRPGSRWRRGCDAEGCIDRKSTRLNSSHSQISYAVFCLKKKALPGLRRSRAGMPRELGSAPV